VLSKLPRPLIDLALVAVTLASTLVLLANGLPIAPNDALPVGPAAVALASAGALSLLARRRHPVSVLVVAAATDTALVALGYRPGLPLTTAVALYAVVSARPTSPRTTAILLGAAFAWSLAVGFTASQMFHGGLALVTAWFAGERTRLRRAQIAELEERARSAEREADHERRLAVAEERARIARDVHDSAGHAINVIGVLAGAARLRGEPGDTLETIEHVARDTVAELDHLLHALRDDTAETSPAGLASLDTLLSQHTSCGLDVTLRAAGPARPLTGSVDQAAYRILQEALTNAARHGTGSARVEVSFGADAVALTVGNPILAGAASRTTGGHGLIGMRERAALTGGRFDAGDVGGSFRVHAELPYACHAS